MQFVFRTTAFDESETILVDQAEAGHSLEAVVHFDDLLTVDAFTAKNSKL